MRNMIIIAAGSILMTSLALAAPPLFFTAMHLTEFDRSFTEQTRDDCAKTLAARRRMASDLDEPALDMSRRVRS